MADDKRGASAQHKIVNLAWLPHFRESEPKRPPASKPVKPVDLVQADVTAGFLTPSGVNRDPQLQGLVDDVLLKENPELKKFKFALADLSKVVDPKKDKPKYAGHNDLQSDFCASLMKVMVMYAAYQLQYDLNVMAQRNPTWNSDKLFEEARAAWADTQVPVKGAATAVGPCATLSFKLAGPNAFDLTMKDHRRQIYTARYAVAVDGRAMTGDILNGPPGPAQQRLKVVLDTQ